MTGTAGSEDICSPCCWLRARHVDARLILVEPDNPVQSFVDQASALGI